MRKHVYLLVFNRVADREKKEYFTFVNSATTVNTKTGKALETRTKYKVERFKDYKIKKIENSIDMLAKATKYCLEKNYIFY